MNNRTIKFRVWDKSRNCWFNDWVGINNHGVVYADSTHGFEDLSLHSNAIIQQYTGLKDKNNIEVYEGDIVNIIYQCGDFALMEMNEKEREEQRKISGKIFTCVVKWDLYGGYELIYKKQDPANFIFPIGYVMNGEVIGNIFENPELLKDME